MCVWQVSPIKVLESGEASEGSRLLPLGGGDPDLEQAAGAGEAELGVCSRAGGMEG